MRVGEKEVSEQAEIVRRYADLFSREQLDALGAAEEGSGGDERELLYRLRKTCESGLISAQLAEREDELENRVLAARVTFKGEEMPLRNAQAQLAVLPSYADREELGAIQAAASAVFNDDRLSCWPRARSSPPTTPGSPTRSSATRRRRTSRCEICRARSSRRATTRPRRTRDCANAGSPSCSATNARRFPPATTRPRCGGSLRSSRPTPRTAQPRSASQTLEALGFDLNAAAEHQARPRRPAAEVAACLRDRERPAAGRAPDHPGAGRAARLPGVPARGGARAALRRLRPRAAVHLPPHLARPRADGDLLVHRRGDLARARMARAVLRPVTRAGTRERRGDDVPRGAALPALRGQAAVRARLLVALRRRRRRRRASTSSC